MTLTRLRALNLLRWIKEYAISWGLLSIIYSLILALILQPVLEKTFGSAIPLAPVWIFGTLLLLVPGAIEYLPVPPVHHRQWLTGEGLFGESAWRSVGGPLLPLYLRHEFRRLPTYLGIAFVVIAASFITPGHRALWILAAQFSVQRGLFSIHAWRALALGASPRDGGIFLLRSFLISQLLQATLAWLAVGLCGFFPTDVWLRLGIAVLGATLTACTVALEGDSGRPWMVNFFSLAAGAIGGFLSFGWPYMPLVAIYFFISMQAGVKKRLHSVEHLDEDRLLP